MDRLALLYTPIAFLVFFEVEDTDPSVAQLVW